MLTGAPGRPLLRSDLAGLDSIRAANAYELFRYLSRRIASHNLYWRNGLRFRKYAFVLYFRQGHGTCIYHFPLSSARGRVNPAWKVFRGSDTCICVISLWCIHPCLYKDGRSRNRTSTPINDVTGLRRNYSNWPGSVSIAVKNRQKHDARPA